MTFVFKMPEVGEGVVEAEVAEWKVAVGDRVEVDQPLCEITTDKASLEISSPRAGVVVRLHGDVGELVRVHTPLVELDTSGAAAPAKAAPAPASAPAPAVAAASAPAPVVAPAPAVAAPAAARAAAPPPVAVPPVAPAAATGPSKAAPAVRRRARELGVDLQAVAATGPAGRVSHADLDAHLARGSAPPVVPLAPVALPQAPPGEDKVIKIVGIRRKIAERMVEAKRTAPHYTYVEEVDCGRLVELREWLKPVAAARGVRLSYLPIWAKLCSMAFRDFPNVNAWLDGDKGELVVKAAHHIGFACDTPNGLMVPVLQHVERKSVLQIAAELEPLLERARTGKAGREELSGSTFTITGVGSIGGVLATPILNLPEVAVLGVNQIRKRAVVDADDRVVVRPTTMLSPSFDHRVIDGAVGARFVARLKALVEEPGPLLLELG